MDSFTTLRGLSAKQKKSRLLQISDLIEWAPFRRIWDPFRLQTAPKNRYRLLPDKRDRDHDCIAAWQSSRSIYWGRSGAYFGAKAKGIDCTMKRRTT